MVNLTSPVSVTLEVTKKCTQNCFFCEPKLAGHRDVESSRGDFTEDEILRILRKLRDSKVLELLISGGEPLMREDLPKIVSTSVEYGLYPSVVTNGLFATKGMSRALREAGLKSIQVSMEGPEKIHDEITSVLGSYRSSLQGIRNLSEELDVVVSSVVTKMNYRYLPEMLEEIGREGIVKGYRTLKLMPLNRESLSQIVPPSELEVINKEIVNVAEKYGIEIIDLSSGLKKGEKQAEYSQAICSAGKTKFDILYDGSVVPCKSLKGFDFVVGNILEDEIEDMWNHPIMKEFRDLTTEKYSGMCGKCDDKWSCYSCRAIAYNLTNSIYGDDVSCFDVLKGFERKEIPTFGD